MSTIYYLIKERSKLKLLHSDKVYINRNTPVGDDAEYYEIKPYGGKKEFYPIGILTEKDGFFQLEDKYCRSLIK